MCLTVNVYIAKKDSFDRDDIKRLKADTLGFNIYLRKSKFSKRGSHLMIVELGAGGCACSLLTDEAGFDSPTWQLRLEVLDGLASLVNRIWDTVGGLLTFDALWYAEAPVENRDVTIEELYAIIGNNKIGSKTRYFIRSEEEIRKLDKIEEKNKAYLDQMEELFRNRKS